MLDQLGSLSVVDPETQSFTDSTPGLIKGTAVRVTTANGRDAGQPRAALVSLEVDVVLPLSHLRSFCNLSSMLDTLSDG